MSDELRAAAKRIEQSGFVWTGDIPVGPGRWTGNPEDAIKLSEAYLAEHPADDGEPTTEEWLFENGFGIDSYGVTVARCGEHSLMWYGQGCIGLESDMTFDVPTRGDVRRLLAALGIEVAK